MDAKYRTFSEKMTRLSQTLAAAEAGRQQRLAELAARQAAPDNKPTFREEMARLTRDSDRWQRAITATKSQMSAHLDNHREAAAELNARRSEVVAAVADMAHAQSELNVQERRLHEAAANIDAAFQSDEPAPFIVPPADAPRDSHVAVAIVTTLRAAPQSCVQAFISHHLDLGFAHIYLFFDDADDPVAKSQWLSAQQGVTVLIRDAELKAEQRDRCQLYAKLSRALPTEVMARQQLNCETAAQRARTARFDWLLHIDIDEAFFLPGANSTASSNPVAAHFGGMDAEADFIAYLNHEAVPERVRTIGETDNYFAEYTLFRRNPHQVSGFWPLWDQAMKSSSSSSSLTEAAEASTHLALQAGRPQEPKTERKTEAAISFWLSRTTRALGAPSYFLAYVNGKSAVRLRPGAPDPQPNGVHRWQGQNVKCAYFDPDHACILHYVNCGLSAFRTKYEMLSECTTSDWFSRLPLYPAARDAAAKDNCKRAERSVPTPDRAEKPGSALGALYRSSVVLEDRLEVERQLAAGVCVRISALAERERERKSRRSLN